MNARARPVAMLDSGLGGLTVLTALRKLAPNVDVVYFADTAHVPYGDRSLSQVAALGTRISERLATHDPLAIVVASGTTCAAFEAYGWPSAADGVESVGVVDAGALMAARASTNRAVGVIATRATIESGTFERALHAIDPRLVVTNVAAPALVPIVEAGESLTERAQVAVAAACVAFAEARCDTVILGCTHFPHLHKWFAGALGPAVALVDPALECAVRVAGLLPKPLPGAARLSCEVSGDERAFAAHAKVLGVSRIDALSHVELPLRVS